MNGLVVGTTQNSGRCSYEQVINAPVPAQTKSYRPVANEQLLHMLNDVALTYGLELHNPEFGMARYGQRLFGVYEVRNHDHFGNQVRLMLGFRNSYDKSLAAGICFGSRVFVCSNLVFTGYADEENGIMGSVRHKHTVNVNTGLFGRLQEALSQFRKFKEFQNNFYERLQDKEISTNRAYATIVKAVIADVLPNKDVIRLAQHWDFQGREPENVEAAENWHEEFRDRNAWSLYNSFTENHKVYQSQNPVEANKRSINLTRLFQAEFSN